MRKPIPLRLDHDAAGLRGLARASEDADQVRRLLALALIYDGGSRTQAAAAGGVTLQVVRDWVLRFNAHGPGGLIDRKAPGQPSRLNDEQRAALAAMVENGPIPAGHGVIRWRIIDLCQWIWEEYQISVSKQTLSRELRAIGYRKLSGAHAITRRRRAPSRLSKKVARHPGGDRVPAWRRCRRYRGVVRRRSQDRPEEQDHPSLGEAGQPAVGAIGPAHRVNLHLRRHLSQRRQGRWTDPALVQHGDDGPASRGDLRRCRSRPSRSAAAGPGWMASLRQAHRTRQHRDRTAAAEVPRTQPAGERLAVYARQ